MSYRITYGQYGNEQDVLNLSAGVYLVAAELKCEANVSSRLTIQLPPNHPMLGQFVAAQTEKELRVYEDGEELFRGRIISDQEDIDLLGKLEAEDQQAYLNDIKTRPYATYWSEDIEDGTVIVSGNLAQHLIEDYNAHCTKGREFSFLGSDVGNNLQVSSTNNPAILDELKDKILDLGAYPVVKSAGQGRVISFVRDIPDGEQTIVLGENMMDYARERNYVDIKTAIIARSSGSDPFGLETVGDGVFGTIRIDGDRAIHVRGEERYGIIEDDRTYEVSTPAQLFAAVENDLADLSMELESIEIKAVDLHLANPGIKPLRMYTNYRIFSATHNVDQMMMLSAMELDLCDPSQSSYHFGSLTKTLTRQESYNAGRSRRLTGDLIRRQDSIRSRARDAQKAADEAQSSANYAVGNLGVNPYGVCKTAGDEAVKTVLVTRPGESNPPDDDEVHIMALDEDPEPPKVGEVVTITFAEANTAPSPTLTVNGVGPFPILTNGVAYAYWAAGQTVSFIYSGECWQTYSTAVYADEATIGDPLGVNIMLADGQVNIRYKDEILATFAQRTVLGRQDLPHIELDETGIDFIAGNDGFGSITLEKEGSNDIRQLVINAIYGLLLKAQVLQIGEPSNSNVFINGSAEGNHDSGASVVINGRAGIYMTSFNKVSINAPGGVFINGNQVG